MKRIMITIIFVFSMMLTGCSYQQIKPETTKKEGKREVQQKQSDKNEGIYAETRYYTLTLPSKWKDLYDLEVTSVQSHPKDLYTLCLYEKENHKEIDAGFLFSVELYRENEDYSYLPSYKDLGNLTVNDKVYHVIVTYPTDVQCTEDTYDLYHQLSNDIDKIIPTFQAKDGYIFEEND